MDSTKPTPNDHELIAQQLQTVLDEQLPAFMELGCHLEGKQILLKTYGSNTDYHIAGAPADEVVDAIQNVLSTLIEGDITHAEYRHTGSEEEQSEGIVTGNGQTHFWIFSADRINRQALSALYDNCVKPTLPTAASDYSTQAHDEASAKLTQLLQKIAGEIVNHRYIPKVSAGERYFSIDFGQSKTPEGYELGKWIEHYTKPNHAQQFFELMQSTGIAVHAPRQFNACWVVGNDNWMVGENSNATSDNPDPTKYLSKDEIAKLEQKIAVEMEAATRNMSQEERSEEISKAQQAAIKKLYKKAEREGRYLFPQDPERLAELLELALNTIKASKRNGAGAKR